MLRLSLVEAEDLPAVGADLFVRFLDPLVACAGDLEVDRVDRAGEVELMILLVPVTRAAFDDLDARPRLGGLPFHSSNRTGARWMVKDELSGLVENLNPMGGACFYSILGKCLGLAEDAGPVLIASWPRVQEIPNCVGHVWTRSASISS